MNKKGVVFTLFTLVLVSSLMLMAIAYDDWFEEYKEGKDGLLSTGKQIGFVRDDIAEDILKLQGFGNVTISRGETNLTVGFLDFLNTSINYSQRYTDYVKIMESNYSSLINWDMEFSPWTYGFSIPEFGVHSEQVGDKLYIYNIGSKNLRSVNLSIIANNYSSIASIPTATDSGSQTVEFYVRMEDRHGQNFFYHTRMIDLTRDNDPSRVAFTGSGGYAEVSLDSAVGQNGVLWFDLPMNATVKSLDLVYYDLNSTITVNTNVTLTLSPKFSNMKVVAPLGLQG